jgi:tetratricopeptide (TPR) repeat protein
LIQQVRYDEAEALVDQVIENDPRNARAHFLKARFYLARNDGANAIPGFRMMVEEHPEEVDGYLNLSQAHILNKEYELAANVLEKGYEALPGQEVLLMALARLHILTQDMAAAEATLKRAETQHPENLRVGVTLGDFYMSRDRYPDALAQYLSLVEKYPEEPVGYVKAAAVYQRLEQPEQAQALLEEGYGRNPDSGLLLTSLVKWHMGENNPEAAKTLCLERLEKDDNEAFTWNLLGEVYLVGKEMTSAKEAFEKAISHQPGWGKPYGNLAGTYLALGEKDAAVEKFEAAVEKDPGNQGAWMILGNLYEKENDLETAARIYAQAFEKNPDMWAAANNYAYLKSEIANGPEDLAGAMEMARKAEHLNPDSWVVTDTIGWIYFKMGDLDRAYEHVSAALEKMPDNESVNYHMGMILDSQGKVSEARPYFEKALNAETDFLGADEARIKLNRYINQN